MATVVASLVEIVEALADQITDNVATADLGGEALQVWPFLVLNPTPPCIDIYPADPFSTALAFGVVRERDVFFTVRARVAPADVDATFTLLYQLMDPRADTSVLAAIASDRTLGGLVQELGFPDPTPTGIIAYSPIQNEGYLVGCEWRTRILL
jgi:hypothetical protein